MSLWIRHGERGCAKEQRAQSAKGGKKEGGEYKTEMKRKGAMKEVMGERERIKGP